MRRPLTEQDKAAIWAGSKAGVPLGTVARRLGRSPGTVHHYMALTGGMRPRPRRAREGQLTLVEREELSRGLAAGRSLRAIARELGRSPSTVSREVARNGGREGYRAAKAHEEAGRRARRPKPARLATNLRLQQVVADKLRLRWSPQQIAHWLREEFPNDPEMRVSHETIYLSLFVQARGALKRELAHHLRTGRVIRRSAAQTSRGQGRGQIVDAVHISERPADAEDRAVPGHWEGDLVAGSGNTHVATLVERHSRFVMLVALEAKTTEAVVRALTAKIQELPEQLKRSLTWDRGTELAAHKQFTVDTGVQVYFCDPKSPWQRGSNENTNGLLRQYFPKGKTLRGITQEQFDQVAAELNGRPRQTLNWRTPSQALEQALR